VIHEGRSGSYPDRFVDFTRGCEVSESILCQPVWSFVRPSRSTIHKIRLRKPSGLSQYPVFKVQCSQEIPVLLGLSLLSYRRSVFGDK